MVAEVKKKKKKKNKPISQNVMHVMICVRSAIHQQTKKCEILDWDHPL